jgi:uncharacterized protein YndB with AHSA1/START domain
MSHLATTIRVAAPPEIVFDLVADPSRGPQWQTMISDMGEISGRPGGVGSSYIGYYRVAGRRLEGRFVVTAAERPTLHQAAGTTRGGWARWTTMIEPVEGGSEVRVDLEFELPGEMIGSLFGKLTGNRLEQELNKTYDNLRKLAEAEARRAEPWSGAGSSSGVGRGAGGLAIADTPDTPSGSDDEGTAAPIVAEPVPAKAL